MKPKIVHYGGSSFPQILWHVSNISSRLFFFLSVMSRKSRCRPTWLNWLLWYEHCLLVHQYYRLDDTIVTHTSWPSKSAGKSNYTYNPSYSCQTILTTLHTVVQTFRRLIGFKFFYAANSSLENKFPNLFLNNFISWKRQFDRHLRLVAVWHYFICSYILEYPRRKEMVLFKEGNILFNDALNTFYLRLYGVGHMVKNHSDSERGNHCRH